MESVACVSQHVLFTHELLTRYNAEGKLDCLTARRGFFSDYSLQCLQKKAITIYVFGKKSTLLWGIFNSYKEKLSLPIVQTATLMESQATAP